MKVAELFERIVLHNRSSTKLGVEMPKGAWPDLSDSTWEDHRIRYDLVAGELAKLYHAGSYSFDDADIIVNALWSDMIARQHPFGREAYSTSPEVLSRVFHAFDCGETNKKGVYFANRRSVDFDPVERFTNPMIAEIVEALSSNEVTPD